MSRVQHLVAALLETGDDFDPREYFLSQPSLDLSQYGFKKLGDLPETWSYLLPTETDEGPVQLGIRPDVYDGKSGYALKFWQTNRGMTMWGRWVSDDFLNTHIAPLVDAFKQAVSTGTCVYHMAQLFGRSVRRLLDSSLGEAAEAAEDAFDARAYFDPREYLYGLDDWLTDRGYTMYSPEYKAYSKSWNKSGRVAVLHRLHTDAWYVGLFRRWPYDPYFALVKAMPQDIPDTDPEAVKRAVEAFEQEAQAFAPRNDIPDDLDESEVDDFDPRDYMMAASSFPFSERALGEYFATDEDRKYVVRKIENRTISPGRVRLVWSKDQAYHPTVTYLVWGIGDTVRTYSPPPEFDPQQVVLPAHESEALPAPPEDAFDPREYLLDTDVKALEQALIARGFKRTEEDYWTKTEIATGRRYDHIVHKDPDEWVYRIFWMERPQGPGGRLDSKTRGAPGKIIDALERWDKQQALRQHIYQESDEDFDARAYLLSTKKYDGPPGKEFWVLFKEGEYQRAVKLTKFAAAQRFIHDKNLERDPSLILRVRRADDEKMDYVREPDGTYAVAGPSEYRERFVDPEAPLAESKADDIAKEAEKAEQPKSEEQAEAGNQKKGHISLQGFEIAIENAKGSIRKSKDPENPWQVTIPAHYGYIKGTEGKDKDHLDVYIGDHPSALLAFVVNQNKKKGGFDEHKIMLGFESKDEAIATYDKAFNGDLGPKLRDEVFSVTIDGLKAWIEKGDTKKPFKKLDESAESMPTGFVAVRGDEEIEWRYDPVTWSYRFTKRWLDDYTGRKREALNIGSKHKAHFNLAAEMKRWEDGGWTVTPLAESRAAEIVGVLLEATEDDFDPREYLLTTPNERYVIVATNGITGATMYYGRPREHQYWVEAPAAAERFNSKEAAMEVIAKFEDPFVRMVVRPDRTMESADDFDARAYFMSPEPAKFYRVLAWKENPDQPNDWLYLSNSGTAWTEAPELAGKWSGSKAQAMLTKVQAGEIKLGSGWYSAVESAALGEAAEDDFDPREYFLSPDRVMPRGRAVDLSDEIWKDDHKLKLAFSWLTRVGLGPKFGTLPIGYYQQDQIKALDKLKAAAQRKGIELGWVRYRHGAVYAHDMGKWTPLMSTFEA